MSKQLFGIDFDDTFSADPEFFREFIKNARARGHECIISTGRRATPKSVDEVTEAVGDLCAIVFCEGDWKREACREAGFEVTIWLDDQPQTIRPPETLKELRTKNLL